MPSVTGSRAWPRRGWCGELGHSRGAERGWTVGGVATECPLKTPVMMQDLGLKVKVTDEPAKSSVTVRCDREGQG